MADTKSIRRSVQEKVEAEYNVFIHDMLVRSKSEIYDNCCKIVFYECVHEYFIYTENIRIGYLEACSLAGDITSIMYDIYLQNEWLRCSTRGDIEEILDIMASDSEAIHRQAM